MDSLLIESSENDQNAETLDIESSDDLKSEKIKKDRENRLYLYNVHRDFYSDWLKQCMLRMSIFYIHSFTLNVTVHFDIDHLSFSLSLPQ